ncbi:hypothetical protein PN466_11500 [Roseofilum reptotaenium CS-1145]|uniref:Uncharacterized protein n=1 Tax=Roseofilum reptotaenium AO1-A TaxID=1925591 RepID=A0A1L9QNK4_9CYAN|nr:hypothetical protein [Roseofilum reptotaenium]MDB9517572.1 hypothetical protein [Roseofilum reptotaenium CS-1145]OJJ24263.1 hypothetical protein BI308_17450 [Roseofilum reptotaenium AO1-A]
MEYIVLAYLTTRIAIACQFTIQAIAVLLSFIAKSPFKPGDVPPDDSCPSIAPEGLIDSDTKIAGDSRSWETLG